MNSDINTRRLSGGADAGPMYYSVQGAPQSVPVFNEEGSGSDTENKTSGVSRRVVDGHMVTSASSRGEQSGIVARTTNIDDDYTGDDEDKDCWAKVKETVSYYFGKIAEFFKSLFSCSCFSSSKDVRHRRDDVLPHEREMQFVSANQGGVNVVYSTSALNAADDND